MIVWTIFHENPSYGHCDISLKTINTTIMVVLQEKWESSSGTMNIRTHLHKKPSKGSDKIHRIQITDWLMIHSVITQQATSIIVTN